MSEKNSIVVFPGTFDPITYGHLDVIERGSEIFDELVVGVGYNPQKNAIFTPQERITLINNLLQERKITNVKVEVFTGMTVDFVQEMKAKAILRGIRTYADFEYEFQLAIANRRMANIETVFVMASAENSFIRSTLIREACALGGNVSAFVPPEVEKLLRERIPHTPQQKGVGLGGEEAPQAGDGHMGLIGEAID